MKKDSLKNVLTMVVILSFATVTAAAGDQKYWGKEGLEQERIDTIKAKRWPKDIEAATISRIVKLGMTTEMVK